MICGRSVLLICNGSIEIHLGIPWVGFAVREAAADIEDVPLVNPNPKTFFPQQGKQLQIRSKRWQTL